MRNRIALTVIVFLCFCSSAAAQEMWTDFSATALRKSYWSVGIDWKRVESGNAFSIAPEYGRILNKYFSLGISGRLTWYATSLQGLSLNIHPYARIHTSFPHPLPNLYAEIGYDFRRRSYDDGSSPSYYQDFGIRPGIDISLSPNVHMFIQFSFSGYQWSRVDGEVYSSWKLFRIESPDRLIGVYFYY